MPALCLKITVVNITNFSVKETKEKSDNLAFWQKIILNPALMEGILFRDKRSR